MVVRGRQGYVKCGVDGGGGIYVFKMKITDCHYNTQTFIYTTYMHTHAYISNTCTMHTLHKPCHVLCYKMFFLM